MVGKFKKAAENVKKGWILLLAIRDNLDTSYKNLNEIISYKNEEINSILTTGQRSFTEVLLFCIINIEKRVFLIQKK